MFAEAKFSNTSIVFGDGNMEIQSSVQIAGFDAAPCTLAYVNGSIMGSVTLPDNLVAGFEGLAQYLGPLKPVATVLDHTLLKAIQGMKLSFSTSPQSWPKAYTHDQFWV